MRPAIAISCGEPAGIGPEIAINAVLQTQDIADCLLIGDASQITALAVQLAPGLSLKIWPTAAQFNTTPKQNRCLQVLDCPLVATAVAGKLDSRNGIAVLRMLECGFEVLVKYPGSKLPWISKCIECGNISSYKSPKD